MPTATPTKRSTLRWRGFGNTVPRSSRVDFPPPWREANLVHRTIMLFEAAQNLGGLQERERARLSPKVNAALDEGRAISAVDYKVAMVLRDAAIVSFTEWLDGYDAIISAAGTGSGTREVWIRPATHRAARCGR